MEQLINKSYQAIVDRGLITSTTKKTEFVNKLKEEVFECEMALLNHDKDNYIEELTDVATVAIMQLTNLGCNFIDEFEKCVLKNEQRAKDVRKHI